METRNMVAVVGDKVEAELPQSLDSDEVITPSLTPTSPAFSTESTSLDGEIEKHVAHDSMVTVRLSEPPNLHIDTRVLESSSHTRSSSKQESEQGEGDDTPSVETLPEDSPRVTLIDTNGDVIKSPVDSGSSSSKPASTSSGESMEEEQVNWDELEKSESQEPKDQWTDDFTALSLARLEQENNLLAANPKSGITRIQNEDKKQKRMSRPPSLQQLKEMVEGSNPAALRYTFNPPPPMTDYQFYAAVVQDYARVAHLLPTLLSKKIRSGVPPPIRGQVWLSMSGARDRLLEDEFDRLSGESSPYEGIIGKDLGRSFPGVEMFRDPEGDGQKKLGRVLKCFSLYDHKIGYCQGLGFIVGPLLMNMDDKQAFCVLVRLMENYDLRNCFLPDLSGLHVRIHQFRELLKQHLPTLSTHLQNLQIEPQYVSQWFLSFFAVTCPLRMLFRIYDVIFAEGASETLMRVALSLMQKNEQKILACTEFEDVMQLLLSRGLWDCYNFNDDEFVEDFVNLSGVVTRDSLIALETSYKESSKLETVIPSDNIGSAASRFLGRLWAGNSTTRNLSPGLSATSRPVSFLRRSPSKQSIASTLNSMEGTGSDSVMSASTEATTISRDSSATDDSAGATQSVNFANATMAPHKSNKDKDLHDQIEDLLMALSEMQRNHSLLVNQLQREREEREEDKNAVRSLLDGLRKKTGLEAIDGSSSDGSLDTVKPGSETDKSEDSSSESTPASSPLSEEDLANLLDVVEDRFAARVNRRSSMLQSKSQLRDELARAKEQLSNETTKSQSLSREIMEKNREIQGLLERVKESNTHTRNAHAEKQRLEKQLQQLKSRKSTASTSDSIREPESEWPSRTSGHGGLRELRLGRQNSARSQTTPTFAKRTSSLNTSISYQENELSLPPPSPTKETPDTDSLLLQLVQAKTNEATAKQEAEEAKAKLENLRRMLGMGAGDSPGSLGHRPSPSLPQSMTGGFLSKPTPRVDVVPPPNPAPTTTTAAVGGFWGWGKRNVSSSEGTKT